MVCSMKYVTTHLGVTPNAKEFRHEFIQIDRGCNILLLPELCSEIIVRIVERLILFRSLYNDVFYCKESRE